MALQALPLALAGLQFLGGALTKPKLNEDEKARVSGSTAEATQRARGLANVSVDPGRDEDEARIRQQQADTLGQAKISFTDPTKIAAVLGGTHVKGLQEGQRLDAKSKQFRAEAGANYIAQLGVQGAEEERVERENRRREQEKITAKRNLFGSGVENILAADKESKMTSFLEKVYGHDLSGGGLFNDIKDLFAG